MPLMGHRTKNSELCLIHFYKRYADVYFHPRHESDCFDVISLSHIISFRLHAVEHVENANFKMQ